MEISMTIVPYGAGVEDSIHVLNPVVNPFLEGSGSSMSQPIFYSLTFKESVSSS
ncbi:unnamed protein product [Sphagnum balticum]